MPNTVIRKIALAHHFAAPPGWCSQDYARARQYSGIVYVLEGGAEYLLSDGKRFAVRQGDCLYIPRGSAYTTRCGETERFVHMTVNFELLDGREFYPSLIRRKLGHPTRFEQLFTRLIHCWNARHPLYHERCIGVLYELACVLLEEITQPGGPYLEKVFPAREYLDGHFLEDFSLTQLAERCGLSEPYFRRLFLRVFHETPAEYRRRLRIAYAEDLLLSGSFSVTQTAQLCGYSDPAYFSRVFRKTMGVSPHQYMEEHLKPLEP